MRVLVTGGNGFVGSHVVERLVAEGYEVRCLLREGSDYQWLDGLDIEHIYGSLSDYDSLLKATENVSIMYHLAAATRALTYEQLREINAEGTKNLVRAVNEKSPNARFVYVSSLAAAGDCTTGERRSEDDPPEPVSGYGRSKLEGEQAVEQAGEWLNWIILRPPTVYGPRDRDIPLYYKFVKFGIVPMIGLSDKYFSLVYIDDLVEAIIEAGKRRDIVKQVFNIAHPEIVTYNTLGGAVAKALGRSKPLMLRIPHFMVFTNARISGIIAGLFGKIPAFNPEKAKEMTRERWTVDTGRASDILQFDAKIDVQEGMKLAVDWCEKHGWS